MSLTPHDQRILRLASTDGQGRLTFHITENGAIALLGRDRTQLLLAEDSLPKLEEEGYLNRELGRSYVLTPKGWDAVNTHLEVGGA